MAQKTYENFDLWIEKSDDRYCVRVIHSSEGEVSADFALTPADFQDLIATFGQTRSTLRDLTAAHPAAQRSLEKIGHQLFETVFTGPIWRQFSSSLAVVQRQNSGLRIRLHLSQAPELIGVPWEYLWEPDRPNPIALSVDTPVVRYLELHRATAPLAVQPPLRILVMLSSPADYPPLKVEDEWRRLKAAVSAPESLGQVVLERLERPTLDCLQNRLREGDVHIFHFIGHGGFDGDDQEGVLLLEADDGKARPTSGRLLGALLSDERTIRLAVLNACEGARTSEHNPFAGVAQSLGEQGIPAVVAMQFPITDHAAITLAEQFYGALADNYPVDAALGEARKAIYTQGNQLEWGTPVLYMRSDDGHIFSVARREADRPVVAAAAAAGPTVAPPTLPPPQPKTVGGYRVISADVLGGRVVCAPTKVTDPKAAAEAVLSWAREWNKEAAPPDLVEELAAKLARIYTPFVVMNGSASTTVTYELGKIKRYAELASGQRDACFFCKGSGTGSASDRCIHCRGLGYEGNPIYGTTLETRPAWVALKNEVSANYDEKLLHLDRSGREVQGAERREPYGDSLMILEPEAVSTEALTRRGEAMLRERMGRQIDDAAEGLKQQQAVDRVEVAQRAALTVDQLEVFSWLLPAYVGSVGTTSIRVDGQTGAVQVVFGGGPDSLSATRGVVEARGPLEAYLGQAAAEKARVEQEIAAEQARAARRIAQVLLGLFLVAALAMIVAFIVLSQR